MQIMYRATRHTRIVDEAIGRRLVASRIADQVGPMEAKAEPVPEGQRTHGPIPAEVVTGKVQTEENDGASTSTGKRKRKYKRRDMRAED